jgi:hypothetical protein
MLAVRIEAERGGAKGGKLAGEAVDVGLALRKPLVSLAIGLLQAAHKGLDTAQPADLPQRAGQVRAGGGDELRFGPIYCARHFDPAETIFSDSPCVSTVIDTRDPQTSKALKKMR